MKSEQSSEKPLKKSKPKRRLLCVFCFLLALSVTLVSAYYLNPSFQSVCNGGYEGILAALAPQNPRWAADGLDDDVFDNSAESVTANQDALTVIYDGEKDFVAERTGIWDLIWLRLHLSDASLSWLNAHTGTQYIVYNFEVSGTTWHYYQHLPDTEYVFVWHE